MSNKQLMTGPKGNSEFCFPGWKRRGKHWDRGGNKTHCFLRDQSLNCFVIPSNSRVEKLWKNRLLYAVWLINLPRFQGARPDHARVESSCCCFPRELVSYVRPRGLVWFEPRHVTCSPPIWNRIWVGRFNKFPFSLLKKIGKSLVQLNSFRALL